MRMGMLCNIVPMTKSMWQFLLNSLLYKGMMCHLMMFINDPGMFRGSCHVAKVMRRKLSLSRYTKRGGEDRAQSTWWTSILMPCLCSSAMNLKEVSTTSFDPFENILCMLCTIVPIHLSVSSNGLGMFLAYNVESSVLVENRALSLKLHLIWPSCLRLPWL